MIPQVFNLKGVKKASFKNIFKMKTGIILMLITLSISSLQVSFSKLSTHEKDGILLMREEEKLAHDVYIQLYEKWNLPVFNNISNSESRHFNAMGFLIEQFELSDPAMDGIGNFRNSELNQLYASLSEKGNQSLNDALEVGAFIEEVDIEDLQNLISSTKNDTILQVYENLLRASGNHLRAFTSQLSARNAEYTPQVLSKEKYKAVLETPHQRGNGNGNCIMQQPDSAPGENGCNGKMRRRRGRY